MKAVLFNGAAVMFSYGDFFMFVDSIFPDKRVLIYYAEFSSRCSFSKTTGSDFTGVEKNTPWLGFEYFYWRNKFGIDEEIESVLQLQTKWVF